jgi:hypothetical protein
LAGTVRARFDASGGPPTARGMGIARGSL